MGLKMNFERGSGGESVKMNAQQLLLSVCVRERKFLPKHVEEGLEEWSIYMKWEYDSCTCSFVFIPKEAGINLLVNFI